MTMPLPYPHLQSRLELCLACPHWQGFWRCAKFEMDLRFRNSLRSGLGSCPVGTWKADPSWYDLRRQACESCTPDRKATCYVANQTPCAQARIIGKQNLRCPVDPPAWIEEKPPAPASPAPDQVPSSG
jgi:hypothetical protein